MPVENKALCALTKEAYAGLFYKVRSKFQLFVRQRNPKDGFGWHEPDLSLLDWGPTLPELLSISSIGHYLIALQIMRRSPIRTSLLVTNGFTLAIQTFTPPSTKMTVRLVRFLKNNVVEIGKPHPYLTAVPY